MGIEAQSNSRLAEGAHATAAERASVLVAEDDPMFQAILEDMLTEWGYDVLLVPDGESAFRELLASGAPKLAVLDWNMPGMQGIEVCRQVRRESSGAYVYIILLTGRDACDDLVAGMEAGADDYVTKPFNAHELRVRLRAGRRIVDLHQQLLAAREKLRVQAMYDCLTSVWNRWALFEALRTEFTRVSRHGSPLSLIMADVDRFKHINDTYGHGCGDDVLREMARRLRASMRAYDGIGRYGGEEFLIVLPGCAGTDACKQAERLLAAINGRSFAAGDLSIAVTCSFGVSWTDRADPAQMETLIRTADEALYLAKSRGRNRVAALPLPLGPLRESLTEPVEVAGA